MRGEWVPNLKGRTEPPGFADGLDVGGRETFRSEHLEGRLAISQDEQEQAEGREVGRGGPLDIPVFLRGGRAGQIHLGAAGGEELWTGGGGQRGAVTWRPEDNQECGALGHRADQLSEDGVIADARA